MKTAPPEIRAVIFDLGNVLAFHDNVKLFREVSALFSAAPEALKQRLEGSGVWDRVNRGQLRGDALRLELADRLGVKPPPADDFYRAWTCHFAINEPMVRHVEKLVGRVKLVLLSNTHDLHVQYLRPLLPVLERFDGLVLSCEVGLIKPEGEIYERALSVAGVPADRAVFFDDLEPYVVAARKVGLHAHVFNDAREVPAQLAALGLPALID
ncbi:MAG: HAD family phosphatase [Myxococcaceae bacterium]|nr:HAD family phosphatase [Myxococcaceae bacterium]